MAKEPKEVKDDEQAKADAAAEAQAKADAEKAQAAEDARLAGIEAARIANHPRTRLTAIGAALGRPSGDVHDRLHALTVAVQRLVGLMLEHAPPLEDAKPQEAENGKG